MHFKTLEIHGFKSFPDRTILNFDTRTTAVVGSNGNGKSNISDALRWVMGEQGAKTLRGDKMEDVIFHGTVARKQMGYAKVVLTIDNTDRALGVDSDEVVIARKLYRTGESEYLINDNKVRLKDIGELLMGTGLGRDGYSIIGQGRVAEIINSKGSQRREIFEEAAGVSKFLHKKAEAERELERANENMLRLKDIALQYEERLPTLEKQSEKAQKAKVLVEREKQLEISVSVNELEQIDRSTGEIDDEILANEGECEQFEREIGELEAESEQCGEEKMTLSVKADELRRMGESAKQEIAEADKQAAVLENEILHHDERVSTIKSQLENSERSRDEFARQIETINAEIAATEGEIAASDTRAAELNEELAGINGSNFKLDEENRELDRRLNELYQMRTAAKTAQIQAQGSIADLTEQLSSAQEQSENREKAIAEYRAKKKQLKLELEELTGSKQELSNKLSGYGRLLGGKRERMETARTDFEKLRRDYEQKKGRYELLSDVENHMEGYWASVKSVITASKAGRLSDIHGTVADVIHVEKKYGVAVEIALGNALQNIIVGNEETAKRCIRYLKETKGGRATFLPLTSIRGTVLSIPELRDEDGFEGIASELVKYDSAYDNIIKSALGKTAIFEDIDTATYIAKKYGYRFRIITLDGQVINAGGSFTGGSVKESAGIISRKQEIETIGKLLGKLSADLETAKATLSEVTAEVNKMSLEAEGFKEQLNALNGDEIRLTAEIAGTESLIRQCDEQQEDSEVTIDRSRSQLAAQQAVIDKYTAVLSQTEAEIAEKTELSKKAGSELEKINARRSELSEQIAALGMKKLSLQKDIENCSTRIAAIAENSRRLREGGKSLLDEINEHSAAIERIKAEIADKKRRIEEINGSYTTNQGEINAVIARTNELEMKIGALNREMRDKIEDKQRFSNALAAAKEKRSAADKEINRIKTALWDKYELAPSEARELAVKLENVREAKNELAELRRKITALGSVNFAAIEEFEEVSQKYGELKTQLDDVEKAQRELEKLIAGLTADIKAKFLASFNDINEHFGVIFKEVFGGGSAHLELSDPDNILESGIEIFAAPPGKLVKNLISLSGGEQTMVAITIYFAILLHRPTPFCMLDEVDAALDEANVVKYISYLKRFSKRTQLMVITHRRGTIEGCDVLYGVYMQEKGVSKLLRQELTEELAAELNKIE